MKSFSLSSLRVRLLLLVMMVALPGLGLITFIALEDREEKASDVQQEAFRLASLVAANQRQLIEATRYTLLTLSRLPEVTRREPQRCQQLLAAVLEGFSSYTNFGVASADGNIFCSALPLSKEVNIADRLYFREAVKTKTFSVGEYQIGRITGKQALNLGYPILNARGEVEAVVYAALDLKWLEVIASEMNLPEGSMVSVMDNKGIVLARIPDPEGWTGRSAAETSIGRFILENAVGTTREVGLDKQRRLYGFTTLAGLQKDARLFFWVSIPEVAAFAEVNRTFTRNLLLLSLITLFILVVAWVGGDMFILRGVNALIRATESLAVGDMRARARLPSDRGELAQLGRSFNKMADSVARRSSELETLRDIDLSILSTLDLKSVLDLLIEKIDIHLPYAAAAVTLWDANGQTLKAAAWRNIDLAESPGNTGQPARLLPDLVAEYRAPLTIESIPDAETGDAKILSKQGFKSYLGIPLQSKGDMLGVLSFYTQESHKFTREEIEFLTTIAGQASIAIYNSRLYEQMKNQAVELERSNKVKDEFLGVMSHELRTPLNVVMGYAELLKDGTLGSVSNAQRDALDKVKHQTAALLAVINEILAATALESRSMKAEIDETDIAGLLDDLRLSYGMLSGKQNVELRWHYPADLPHITTDSAKLSQILHNLIGNAIKFTEQGSVTISAAHNPGAGTVEFRVADTGIGIPEEFRPAIFEKFRQGDSSTLRGYEGVGLGLYIARQFSSLLAGQITVESEPGKGSTFMVTIPSGCRSPLSDN